MGELEGGKLEGGSPPPPQARQKFLTLTVNKRTYKRGLFAGASLGHKPSSSGPFLPLLILPNQDGVLVAFNTLINTFPLLF